MKIIPGGMPPSARTASSMVPRRVETRTIPPGAMPNLRRSIGAIETWASGSISSSTLARLVIAPVCRSEEHTSELQSHSDLVCRLLLEKKKKTLRLDTQQYYL